MDLSANDRLTLRSLLIDDLQAKNLQLENTVSKLNKENEELKSKLSEYEVEEEVACD